MSCPVCERTPLTAHTYVHAVGSEVRCGPVPVMEYLVCTACGADPVLLSVQRSEISDAWRGRSVHSEELTDRRMSACDLGPKSRRLRSSGPS